MVASLLCSFSADSRACWNLRNCVLQVSFVNSICTIKGGTHVTYLTDQITK